ncbi:hypothetical protein ACFYNM_21620 [Streptomyces spororaveus]|uniref:hypothetical protein n=1 Tax=Streptomyces spororaveus TaxID=284039 RepID=UPI0036A2B754
METDSRPAREQSGKGNPEDSPGGNPWIGATIVSILASSLTLIMLDQQLYLVILIAAGLGELARTLSDIMGGWNRVTVSTLLCFEVVGLMLVGFYRVEGALVELTLLVAVWVIGRLRKEGGNGPHPADDLPETTAPETATSNPSVPRQVTVKEGSHEVSVADPGAPGPSVSQKVVVSAGLFVVFLIVRKKLYRCIKGTRGRNS